MRRLFIPRCASLYRGAGRWLSRCATATNRDPAPSQPQLTTPIGFLINSRAAERVRPKSGCGSPPLVTLEPDTAVCSSVAIKLQILFYCSRVTLGTTSLTTSTRHMVSLDRQPEWDILSINLKSMVQGADQTGLCTASFVPLWISSCPHSNPVTAALP